MSDVDKLWKKLQSATECHSLLKKHLTLNLVKLMKSKKTKYGGTLADCIRSGCENPDSGVGIYASDPEAYTLFGPIFQNVIKDYHKVATISHPESDFGEDKIKFEDLDPTGEIIVSTRVRVGRSHAKFGFPPTLTKTDRIKMEQITLEALNTLDGDLKGIYWPLCGMSIETRKKLTEEHYLFNDNDRFLKAAGGYADWPVGRGIYQSHDKKFLVWVNEEDHLRLISMQPGGNLKEVYLRLVTAIRQLEKKLQFAKMKGLGYLTFCPSNLGTTLRASVHIRIPKLSASPQFKAFCDKHNIQARGIHGEHTESGEDGVYDISNRRRLGLTEYEAIMEMKKGVEAVIAEEKRLGSSSKGSH